MIKRGAEPPKIKLQGQHVTLGGSMKCLGITFKNKVTMFGFHPSVASKKAQKIMDALERLMPNVRGLKEKKRHVLILVLLYGVLA